MHRYRVEFRSKRSGTPGTSLDVPDIPTALVVAEINMTGGTVHLYDGERQLADLQRQPGSRGAYWYVQGANPDRSQP